MIKEQVIIPEPDEPEPSNEYHGEFRFVNVPPTRLRVMLERENLTASDKEAVQIALRAWGKMGEVREGTEAGEPYRGETRVAQVVSSIRELVANMRPVEAIVAAPLSSPGHGTARFSGEPQWLGIFDFDVLEAELKEFSNETMGDQEG